MGSFGPIVSKIYVSLHHKIRSKDYFQTSQHDRAQKVEKNLEDEIYPKNPLLHQMANVGTIMAHNYTILYLRICAKICFLNLES